jgi:hypothetical protein
VSYHRKVGYYVVLLVVFLGPRANAELVPKFHVALHASHAALPLLTSKFRPNIALPKCTPSSVIKIYNNNKKKSDYMLYLYQKDKRAQPGNLQNRRYSFLPLPHVVSLTTTPTSSLSLSLSLSLSVESQLPGGV